MPSKLIILHANEDAFDQLVHTSDGSGGGTIDIEDAYGAVKILRYRMMAVNDDCEVPVAFIPEMFEYEEEIDEDEDDSDSDDSDE